MTPLDSMPAELRMWLLYAAIFLVVFAVSFVSLRDFSAFDRRTSAVLAVCVSVIGLIGMPKGVIEAIMASYAAMGATILVSLAVLVLTLWLTVVIRGRKR